MKWLSALLLSLLIHFIIIFAYFSFEGETLKNEEKTITGIKFLQTEKEESIEENLGNQNQVVSKKSVIKPTQENKIEKPINENYQEPLSEVVQPEEVLNFEDYLDEELNQSFIEFNNDIVEEIKQKIILDLINIWIKPNNTSKDIFAEFNLEVDRLGNVESFVMIRSSGSEAFDRAAIRAINKYKKIAYIKEIDDDTYETYFSNFTIRFKPQ